MSKLDELINKSLEDIDSLANTFSKSQATEDEVAEDNISKAQDDEDLSSGDVSDDAPEDNADDEAPEDSQDSDEGDSDTDDEGEEDTDADDEDDMDKSLEEELNSNESVRKALEVSEFLQELVKGISTVIGAQGQELKKSMEANNEHSTLIAKSFEGIVKSQRVVLEAQAEMNKSIRSLSKRLKTLEGQPVVRKSVDNVKAINKSFEASLGAKPTAPKLSKSEAVSKLVSAFEGGQHDLQDDILALDGTGNFNALSQNAKNVLGL